MLITRETDYALRMLRVLLDEEKHSAAEMAETELIPMQFAYQILRKLSAGELVQVSRGAAGGCRLSCDLRGVSLYDLMAVMGEHDVLCACMEPGYHCRWQSELGKCDIHCQLTELQRKQDEAFRAVRLRTQLFKNGECLYQPRALSAIRAHCLAQVDTLWEEVTRFENPHSYYVDLSQKLWDEKNRLLSENQY